MRFLPPLFLPFVSEGAIVSLFWAGPSQCSPAASEAPWVMQRCPQGTGNMIRLIIHLARTSFHQSEVINTEEPPKEHRQGEQGKVNKCNQRWHYLIISWNIYSIINIDEDHGWCLGYQCWLVWVGNWTVQSPDQPKMLTINLKQNWNYFNIVSILMKSIRGIVMGKEWEKCCMIEAHCQNWSNHLSTKERIEEQFFFNSCPLHIQWETCDGDSWSGAIAVTHCLTGISQSFRRYFCLRGGGGHIFTVAYQ